MSWLEGYKEEQERTKDDPINPSHYKQLPGGIEVIQITEHMPFNTGNAVKYILRAGHKTPDPIQDYRKAIWYLEREIKRRELMK